MVQGLLPNIPYLTFMDKYVARTILLLAFFIVLSVWSFANTQKIRLEALEADKVDDQHDIYVQSAAFAAFGVFQVAMTLYAWKIRRRELAKQTKIFDPGFKNTVSNHV
jgi:hypothetical protein